MKKIAAFAPWIFLLQSLEVATWKNMVPSYCQSGIQFFLSIPYLTLRSASTFSDGKHQGNSMVNANAKSGGPNKMAYGLYSI